MNTIEEILKLSPPVLLIVALVCLGRVLKGIPHVANWAIPVILPLVGATVYTVLGPAFPLSWIAKVQYPFVAYGMIGFICGSTAVWGHQVWRNWTGRNDIVNTTEEPK
jgi:hypothetical protein